MRNRIRQIMEDKGMSQKNFANELCIAEATLSGIFNGRTRPTNQTVQAIHERFPEVNISWLMFDEGQPYIDSPDSKSPGDVSAAAPEQSSADASLVSAETGGAASGQMDLFADQEAFAPSRVDDAGVRTLRSKTQSFGQGKDLQIAPQLQIVEKYIDKPQRKIVEIRVFFDDGTYESFSK